MGGSFSFLWCYRVCILLLAEKSGRWRAIVLGYEFCVVREKHTTRTPWCTFDMGRAMLFYF